MHAPLVRTALAALALLIAAPSLAHAQFDNVNAAVVRERIGGVAIPGSSVPDIQPGDQLGAFFGDQTIGSFTFTDSSGSNFEITLNGDNPDTSSREGPRVGERVEFRFFDSSTNFVFNNIRVETTGGERFNFTFQGQAVPNIPGFPLDLTPTREFNVRISEGGGGGSDGGGGGDGGGEGPTGTGLDVNGDGSVDRLDVQIVIRAIAASNVSERSGAAAEVRNRFVTAGELQSADVNDDGVVSTQDVMAVIRGMRMRDQPDAGVDRPTSIDQNETGTPGEGTG